MGAGSGTSAWGRLRRCDALLWFQCSSPAGVPGAARRRLGLAWRETGGGPFPYSRSSLRVMTADGLGAVIDTAGGLAVAGGAVDDSRQESRAAEPASALAPQCCLAFRLVSVLPTLLPTCPGWRLPGRG